MCVCHQLFRLMYIALFLLLYIQVTNSAPFNRTVLKRRIAHKIGPLYKNGRFIYLHEPIIFKLKTSFSIPFDVFDSQNTLSDKSKQTSSSTASDNDIVTVTNAPSGAKSEEAVNKFDIDEQVLFQIFNDNKEKGHQELATETSAGDIDFTTETTFDTSTIGDDNYRFGGGGLAAEHAFISLLGG